MKIQICIEIMYNATSIHYSCVHRFPESIADFFWNPYGQCIIM